MSPLYLRMSPLYIWMSPLYIYGCRQYIYGAATKLKDAETVFAYLEPDVGAFAEVWLWINCNTHAKFGYVTVGDCNLKESGV
jgi:hypothetical protein